MSLFSKIVQLMMRIPLLQNIRLLFYLCDSVILWFIKKPVKQCGKKKVLIVFTHALGDSVMFYGSIPYIYEIYPKEKYEITITCHSSYEELFKNEFDHVLPIDYRKSTISLKYRIQFLRKIRQEYYDVAIDPIGAEECSPNVYAMNAVCAEQKIGVLTAQDKKYQCPKWLRRKAYDKVIEKKEKNVHKVRHYTEFWSEIAGKKFEPKVAELPVGNSMNLHKKYVVICPSASILVKIWPVERYAEIAKKIFRKTGYAIMCCGTNSDKEVTDKFIELISNEVPVINMLGKTSVLGLIEIVGRAELVLTNDTSVFHIAVATGRKTCVVSGGYVYSTFLDYLNNGYGEAVESRVRLAAHKEQCMNCNNNCKYKVDTVYPCVEKITEAEVWNIVETLIIA